MNSQTLTCLAALVGASLAAPAGAQPVWRKLATEGDTLGGANLLPGFSAADTVRSNGFRDLRFAPNGNFVTSVNTDPSQGNTSNAGSFYLWGSTTGGDAPVALRREGLYDGLTQTALGNPTGIDNSGNVLYRANTGTPSGPVSMWRNGTRLFAEGDTVTAPGLAGNFYDSFSNTTLTPAGVERWISNYAANAGGVKIGAALLQNAASPQVLLKTGDSIGGGMTITVDLLNGNLAWSLGGTNYLAGIDFSTTSVNDAAIVLNGQVVSTLGGGVLREGDAIPAAAGGLVDETWSIGSLVAVNEAGDWVASASALPVGHVNTTRDFLVVNGAIRYRDGDVVDGHTLSGLPSYVSLNDRGDLGFVWDNIAFVNDKIVAKAGDLIDTNGDGTGDAAILNLFDIDLTNLVSGEGDGSPVSYLQARIAGGLEGVFRNRLPTLAGDYNGDGAVNAADYTAWRDTLGSTLLLSADGDGDNVIDADDYNVWSANYGAPPALATAVPEPSCVALLAVSAGVAAYSRRR
ncbi:MAG: hypothetical protein ACRCT8_00055 [Lacipirellulaceae bacterium]